MTMKLTHKAILLFAAVGFVAGSFVACGSQRKVKNGPIQLNDERKPTTETPAGGTGEELGTVDVKKVDTVVTPSGETTAVTSVIDVKGTAAPVEYQIAVDKFGLIPSFQSYIGQITTSPAGLSASDLLQTGDYVNVNLGMKCLSDAEINGRMVKDSTVNCPFFVLVTEVLEGGTGVAVDQNVVLYKTNPGGEIEALISPVQGEIDRVFFVEDMYDSFSVLIEKAVSEYMNAPNM